MSLDTDTHHRIDVLERELAQKNVELQGLLERIRELGARVGVAINPGTPTTMLDYVLDAADLVVVMSVNPGFGGQTFIPATYAKLVDLKNPKDPVHQFIREHKIHVLKPELATGAKVYYNGLDGAVR